MRRASSLCVHLDQLGSSDPQSPQRDKVCMIHRCSSMSDHLSESSNHDPIQHIIVRLKRAPRAISPRCSLSDVCAPKLNQPAAPLLRPTPATIFPPKMIPLPSTLYAAEASPPPLKKLRPSPPDGMPYCTPMSLPPAVWPRMAHEVGASMLDKR